MLARPVAITARNGNRVAFRSQLEARWALFFDTFGFKWNYEPFRCRLSNGLTYTPDFEVDGIGLIEVKPTFGSINESLSRIELFIAEQQKRLLLFYGCSPFDSAIAIIHSGPDAIYFCDRQQFVIILGGTQRREQAKLYYDALHDSVFNTLRVVSNCTHTSFEPLSVQEIMMLQDTRESPDDPRSRQLTELGKMMVQIARQHKI